VVVLFAVVIGVFLALHPLLMMSPVLSTEKQQLFRSAKNCQLVESWKVDFEGTHAPYTIERRRCTTKEQLKATTRAAALRDEHGWGLDKLDFVLVEQRRLFRNTIVAGWDCDGECPKPVYYQLSAGPVLLLTSVPGGSGGYDQWCFLGWMGGYIGCWHLPDEVANAQRIVNPDEMMHALHPNFKDGKVEFSAKVGGPNDSNCCPTRGWVHIVLAAGDGDFRVERIYRTP
jgi:hypothetical protein